jgi:hypothetical protein
MHLQNLRMMSVSAVLLAACSSGRADQPPVDERPQQATLPQKLCELLPQGDAERIMGKSLVQKRNDDWACEYQDARGTGGTGLSVFRNALEVSDQCRLTPGREAVSGLGDQACIAIKVPVGLYTTVVFRGGGHTFEVVAPGEGRASELATAAAKVILSKLGS